MRPKTPKEDPRIKSAREAAERRADASFIADTGELLDEETRRRIRKFGNRATAARTGAGAGGGARGGRGFGGAGLPGGSGSSDGAGGYNYNGFDARNPGVSSVTV